MIYTITYDGTILCCSTDETAVTNLYNMLQLAVVMPDYLQITEAHVINTQLLIDLCNVYDIPINSGGLICSGF